VEEHTNGRVTPDGTLTLTATQEDSICTLAVAGELDMANALSLSRELERLESTDTPLKVDLSELEFIDSTGIAILVTAYQRLGQRLQLVPSEALAVRRVLSLTGLDAELPFAPSLNGG
jgi:anti-sigma B factor antagonist